MRSNGNSSSASNFVSFAERLKSFSKKSPKWPHPETFLANPNSLAAAGFYFSPSNDNKDAVSCFICQKGLADWDPTDDPAAIHFDKCSACPWATLKCISDGPDNEGRYNFPSSRIPSSKEMEKARLETFVPGGKSWWPQDGRNKGPSSKLMAKAGFIFTPTSSSKKDDTCSCIYCGIELGGWQVDDDPMEEHCRRQEKNGPCPFFTVQEAPAKSQQNSKTNNTLSKRNTSSRSKSKHKSTPSLTVQPVVEEEGVTDPPPSLTAQPAIEEEDLPPPSSHPKKTKTTTSKPKAKSKAKPKSRPKSPPRKTTSENISPVSPTNDTKQPEMEEIPKPLGREEEQKQELEPEPEPEPEPLPAPIQVQKQGQQQPESEPETEPEPKHEPPPRPQQDQEAESNLEPTEEQKQAPLTPVKSHRLSVPIPSLQTLTEPERLMTVEQWIRAEMQRQYELFEAHGRSRIEAFKLRAAEVAERIEQL